ncbi:NUDIX domain-containing protein [Flexivirga caeni]|uniref:NUDIX hydrolase n=1 Tax=Flexivirga caeni TaxID=2294115 RepID=A0A3M9MH68_9MICO|nr:NUDIX hydrolase [Flexivirga caeni]RNI24910.1 NUDIX hydrolase [Flexivirga caeni]
MSRSDPAPPTQAAGVAVFRSDGALLLGRHTHDDRWATFGGAVEPGEDAVRAATRELREETGLVVTDVEELGSFGGSDAYTVLYRDGSTEAYEVTMFATIIDDSRWQPDGAEIAEIAWFSSAEMPMIDLAPDMVDIVPAAFAWFEETT